MRCKAFIYNGKNKLYYFRKELWKMGFTFTMAGTKYVPRYYKEIQTEQEKNEVELFCAINKLKVEFHDQQFSRASNYRNIFFDCHPGYSNKNLYQCAYCGKFMTAEKVSVDHLFPIAKARSNKFNQFMLKKLDIENINQKENLVASCKRCNQKKGSKTGIWVVRGWLGRYLIFWIIVWSLYLIFFVLVIYSLLYLR